MKNIYIFQLYISIFIVISRVTFAADLPKLDQSCSAKDFEALRLRQNCIFGGGDSCLVETFVGSMQGSPVAKSNLASLTDELPSDLKTKLNNVANSQTGNSVSAVRQALKVQFSSELSKLENLGDRCELEIMKSRKDYLRGRKPMDHEFSNWNKSYWDGPQRKLEEDIHKKYATKRDELLRNNPKLRLANLLLEGAQSLETTLGSEQVAKTLADISKDEKVKAANQREINRVKFIDDRYPIERTNALAARSLSSRFGGAAKSAAGGVGLFSVGLLGGFVSEKIQGRMQLSKCRGEFGFSDQEVDYLKDGSFYSLRVKSSENCKDFGLFTEDPMIEFNNILKKFNGVPSGLCKMVKTQLERLNKISPELKISKSSCSTGDISGNGFKIDTSDKSEPIIKVRTSGGQEYSILWNDKTAYPEYATVGRYGTTEEMRQKQKRLWPFMMDRQMKYGGVTGLGKVLYTPEEDLLAPCDEPTYCEIRQQVAKARTAYFQQRTLCEQFFSTTQSEKVNKPEEYKAAK